MPQLMPPWELLLHPSPVFHLDSFHGDPSSCSSSFHIQLQPKGLPPPLHLLSSHERPNMYFSENSKIFTKRIPNKTLRTTSCKSYSLGVTIPSTLNNVEDFSRINIFETSSKMVENLVLIDLDPATAKLAIPFVGPFLSAFAFLFIVRIVMSWYPRLPVDKFPYILAFAPAEPILIPTRKVIPPLGGVDVTPVVWFGLVSFLNEILVGPQGLLVLLSQQQGFSCIFIHLFAIRN